MCRAVPARVLLRYPTRGILALQVCEMTGAIDLHNINYIGFGAAAAWQLRRTMSLPISRQSHLGRGREERRAEAEQEALDYHAARRDGRPRVVLA